MTMKLLMLVSIVTAVVEASTAYNADTDVKYIGVQRNGVETFLGIYYAQDTSGENRFKPPQPHIPAPGSVIDATKPGHACPQQLGQYAVPLALLNVTHDSISEDCLNLNIIRPKYARYGTTSYPVMVWIHGGGFWIGSNMEPTTIADSLVRESVDEGDPIIHVAINYRLGYFGFAQSGALREEKSENAGLRDQRMAIEWVRDNIQYFGGNGSEITIHGQSSGGLAVGVQLLAYGGEKPLPYQRGICQSQALEPGIAGNFSRDAMSRMIDYLGCNAGNSSLDAPEAIECLRSKDTQTSLNASLETYNGDISHNIGDIWLPSIDGDFFPAPISTLVEEGRFGDATYMLGWTQGDLNWYTDVSIRSEADTRNFLESYLPLTKGRSSSSGAETLTEEYLKMYPLEQFTPPRGTNLTAQFYRTARVFRDILMVCEPMLLAKAMHKKGNTVYLYNFNQTLLDPIIESVSGIKHLGVVHTSEFAYTNAHPNIFKDYGYRSNPTEADYALATRASRSWAKFAHSGHPSSPDGSGKALKGWKPAFETPRDDECSEGAESARVYTIGGPHEGLWSLDGPDSIEPVRIQNIEERCAFFNDPSFIELLQF